MKGDNADAVTFDIYRKTGPTKKLEDHPSSNSASKKRVIRAPSTSKSKKVSSSSIKKDATR